jgi:xylulokinase
VFPGSFVLAAGTATAGTLTRWIADILALDSSLGDEKLFGDLVALAQQSPVGARGVLVLPHLRGERTPVQDPHSRGIIFGLSLEHSRADVARAAIEGIAHSIAHAFSTYDLAGVPTQEITAIGGGTKNPILVESVSSLIGKSQQIAASSGASYGDAVLAALATGAIPNRGAIKDWVSVVRNVEPDPVAAKRLRSDYADYVELYATASSLAHRRAGIAHD